ncbi:MAG: VWA domain-containing protein [Phycisphaerae bacterium]|nr:VWA domain-containing protein [Phycisphaerae bacterium]
MMSIVSLVTSLLLTLAPPADPAPRMAPPDAVRAAHPSISLADVTQEERDAIERLRHGTTWVRRAFGAARLARYDCEASEVYLRDLLTDRAWHVRCYALLACARRGIVVRESAFASETEPRVIRTALRCRYAVPREPLAIGAARLAKSGSLDDRLLALELATAGSLSTKELDQSALLASIIMRMDRVEAGSLSTRLAAITGGNDSARSYRWRAWYRKNRKDPGLHGAFLAPPRDGDGRVEAGVDVSRGVIAALSTPRLLELERHMQDLSGKSIEIVIALDCTASMSGELAECQSGVDALMMFVRGIAKDLRIGFVGYRDEKDLWETKAWDFTRSVPEARERLWQLSAEGGGDRPESVAAALKLAYGTMTWDTKAAKSLILVGDAPPYPGTGDRCVTWAAQALATGIRTYTIAPAARQAATEPAPVDIAEPSPTDEAPAASPAPPGRPGPAEWRPPAKGKRDEQSPWRKKLGPGEVEYWNEIADAGGGRCVHLPKDASLIAEIAGLTLGDTFQREFDDFFDAWTALCR